MVYYFRNMTAFALKYILIHIGLEVLMIQNLHLIIVLILEELVTIGKIWTSEGQE